MNFWIYKKKNYIINLQKVLKNNNFFFFWNLRTLSLKDFIYILAKSNIYTIWLKKNTFLKFYQNDIKLKKILTSQCYFSYGLLSDINFKDFIQNISKSKNNIIILGLILNNNLFLDLNRFKLLKNELNYLNDINKIYIKLINHMLRYYVLIRINFIRNLYLLNYKKNFSIIK